MHTRSDADDRLSDDELLAKVDALVARERAATTELIAALAQVERRRLYRPQGFSSLYAYCTERLHLSEYEAYTRMIAARAALSYPVILELLTEGALTLTAVALLARHLTSDNYEALLAWARHKTKREVLERIAELHPQPAQPALLRPIVDPRRWSSQSAEAMADEAGDGEATTGDGTPPLRGVSCGPSDSSAVTPIAPDRYEVHITISREAYEMLCRLQDLMRHVVPSGDPARIVEHALRTELAQVERRITARTERPHRMARCTSGTRYIPAHVRRAVWQRDGGRCAFVGIEGRCPERAFLQFEHRLPYSDGGATTTDNVELLCQAHNAYEAEMYFGLNPEGSGPDPPQDLI